MLELLKFASLVATAGFGIFASAVDLKHDDGRYTKLGLLGICGILASAILSAILQLHSERNDEANISRLLSDNNALLTQIDRSLIPLDKAQASFELTSDFETDPFVAMYKLMQATTREQYQGIDGPKTLIYGPSASEDSAYSYAVSTFCALEPALHVFKMPIDPSDFKFGFHEFGIAGEDLKIRIPNPCFYQHIRNEIQSMKLSWVSDGDTISDLAFHSDPVNLDPIDSLSVAWRGNGKVLYLDDLLNSQIIIQLSTSGYWGVPVDDPKLKELKKNTSLSSARLKLGSGITLKFDSDSDMIEHVGKDGHHFYSIQMPSTREKLLDLLADTS